MTCRFQNLHDMACKITTWPDMVAPPVEFASSPLDSLLFPCKIYFAVIPKVQAWRL